MPRHGVLASNHKSRIRSKSFSQACLKGRCLQSFTVPLRSILGFHADLLHGLHQLARCMCLIPCPVVHISILRLYGCSFPWHKGIPILRVTSNKKMYLIPLGLWHVDNIVPNQKRVNSTVCNVLELVNSGKQRHEKNNAHNSRTVHHGLNHDVYTHIAAQ